jgi:hypothetical protein
VITWPQIALALLKLVLAVVQRIDREQFRNEGYQAAVAETLAAIVQKTNTSKAILERVDAMSDSEVDDALHNLEPK